MKRYGIMLAVSFLLANTGCKRYLEPTPSDFLTPETYYQNKSQLSLSLNGIYQVMSQAASYGEMYQYTITNATDESVTNFNTNLPGPSFYNSTPSNSDVINYWANLYTGINRANLLLENINVATDISDNDRRHIKGEAVFLRAYYYFLLTQWFGDVPLRLNATGSALDTDFEFTGTKEVYDFVIGEMTTAEGLLNDQPADAFNYTERVTLTTVQGMLARVCLYAAGQPVNDTKRMAEALSWAQKVVASGKHRLTPDYTQIFKLESADGYDLANREVMWEVGFSWNPTNTGRLTASQVRVGIPTQAMSVGRSYGWTNIYPRVFKAYESVINPAAPVPNQDLSPDLRREWNCPVFTYTGGDATTPPNPSYFAYNNYWDRYPGKWRRQYEIVTPRDNNNSPRNLPIIRYADVLLMLAEADNELNGPTALGIDAVNQIRKRGYGENIQGKSVIRVNVSAGGSGYTSAPVVTITGGGGSGTTATATISGGRITAINLTTLGANYSTAPTVTITGGGGSGAAADAVLSDATLTADKYASKEVFRKTIQDERLRELNGEFLRKQDLKRWGLLIPTLRAMVSEATSGSTDRNPDGTQVIPPAASNVRAKYTIPGSNISEKDIYLPIPQTEITYNRQARQNPGY